MRDRDDRQQPVDGTEEQDELMLEQADLDVDADEASSVTGGISGDPCEGGQISLR